MLLEIKSPSILSQGEVGKEVRSPQGWGPTPPPEHHTLGKILERMELGSEPDWQFLSPALFPGVKILLPLSRAVPETKQRVPVR